MFGKRGKDGESKLPAGDPLRVLRFVNVVKRRHLEKALDVVEEPSGGAYATDESDELTISGCPPAELIEQFYDEGSDVEPLNKDEIEHIKRHLTHCDKCRRE